LKLLALNLYDNLAAHISSPETTMTSRPMASGLMANITEEMKFLEPSDPMDVVGWPAPKMTIGFSVLTVHARQ
jgi:hypothetical protein